MKKIDKILSEVLVEISPPDSEMNEMNKIVNDFLKEVSVNIKKNKIDVQAFVGGSFSKGTVTKKDDYDVDIFFRFDKKYSEKEYSYLIAKILKGRKYEMVHGSREYFRIKVKNNFYIEVVPVKKISKPSDAENITDLSYSHVMYLKKVIKNKKLLDEIKLAKAFCFANKVYGAESYIRGFSGYGLELLIYYYGSFEKMLRNLSKVGKEKLIIDIEKFYPRKKEVLLDINESKLDSPIILIDPTYKTRNVLAALSEETFERFQKASRKFLKNPSKKDFELKKIDFDKIRKDKNSLIIEVSTSKQAGDVAGTKLLKFYNHFIEETSKYFIVSKKGFEYGQEQIAKLFLVAKPKKEIVLEGPLIVDRINCLKFRKGHPGARASGDRLIAREKVRMTLGEFFSSWVKKNKKKINEMYITGLKRD